MKVIYVLMFVSMWTTGILFLLNSNKNNFWSGMCLLVGGMASFTFAMHLSIMPVLLKYDLVHPIVSAFLYVVSVIAMNLYFYFLPYIFSMGGLWLSNNFSIKIRVVLSTAMAVIPVVLMLNHAWVEGWNQFDVSRFRWWDGAYVALGCVFYFMSVQKETDAFSKKSKRRVGFIFSSGMTWAFFSDYVGFEQLKLGMWKFELQSNGTWQYNFILILLLVGLVIYNTVRYGFLGIKLKIERERLDYSMRALTMGVSILNHSIKNEIQKINYLTEKSSDLIRGNQPERSLQAMEQVHTITAHLLNMVSSIKEKADDVVLQEKNYPIRELLEAAVDFMKPSVEHKEIGITLSMEADGELYCDPVHLKETLSNLIQNAIDAMPSQGGVLQLRTYVTRKGFYIELKDNGAGIPKENLSKIFEPFYTTKKNTLNHGLGLSYCYSVLLKHGGQLSIPESEINKGTTVRLQFPIQKFTPSSKVIPTSEWKAPSVF
ncbi:sensor histidine kinase [Paenibacillus sedimenti]|uniref:histidine kinase n=1 Tax=Paenibacillus sedimenti TaxID=2770274 RepID=A0A926KLB9_9BACL|nr:HAMP domain-containing sensor histidine kinase [Paenibacillus sedimenti]MBD0378891.1 HAMP domain-containing histidine kinase [Paenibacillus sedimenti]